MPLDEHPKITKRKDGRKAFDPPAGADPEEFERRVQQLARELPLYTASRIARLEFLGVPSTLVIGARATKKG